VTEQPCPLQNLADTACKNIRLGSNVTTTATRSEMMPELPTIAENVPGYESSTWYGVGAPKDTPTEIVDKLNKAINVALADPSVKMRFHELGGSVIAGSPADFGKLIADETAKWAKVVKFSGAKPE